MLRMLKTAALALVLLLVSGCSYLPDFGTRAVEARRDMNDLQAAGTLIALCDISIGASYRVLSDGERQMVNVMCGGELAARPLTASDVRMVLELRDALAR